MTGSAGGSPAQGAPRPRDHRFEGRDYGRDRDNDRFYRERDDFFRDRDWRGQLFARIHRDLDCASRDSFRGDDRYCLTPLSEWVLRRHLFDRMGSDPRKLPALVLRLDSTVVPPAGRGVFAALNR